MADEKMNEGSRLKSRLEILEALDRASTDERIVPTIDASLDRADAKRRLSSAPFHLSSDQAEAVLAQTLGSRTEFARLARRDEMAAIQAQLREL